MMGVLQLMADFTFGCGKDDSVITVDCKSPAEAVAVGGSVDSDQGQYRCVMDGVDKCHFTLDGCDVDKCKYANAKALIEARSLKWDEDPGEDAVSGCAGAQTQLTHASSSGNELRQLRTHHAAMRVGC